MYCSWFVLYNHFPNFTPGIWLWQAVNIFTSSLNPATKLEVFYINAKFYAANVSCYKIYTSALERNMYKMFNYKL